MTRKQRAHARKDAWTLALAEGRVVRYPELSRFTSYPTVAAAVAARDDARDSDLAAEILTAEFVAREKENERKLRGIITDDMAFERDNPA